MMPSKRLDRVVDVGLRPNKFVRHTTGTVPKWVCMVVAPRLGQLAGSSRPGFQIEFPN
jgi:hypothetical protein